MSWYIYVKILRFTLRFLSFMVSVKKFPAQYCPLLADDKPNSILKVKRKLESSEREILSLKSIRIDCQVLALLMRVLKGVI